ncbi:MAG: DUF368 domain-containing protein [Clostridia bacterium]|nr:DUF368 domain-containing protein [Clostridia bacterium]
MRKHHSWLHTILCGLLIGIACILPGASGGVLAVSFGLYRPMLDAAMHFFREPKRHLRLLLPLGAGICAGILLGAVGLSGAMRRYERLMLFLFIGLILGGIPDLLQEASQHEPFRPAWLLSLAAGVCAALPLCLLGGEGAAVSSLSAMQAFLTGVLEGVGTVVPGISTSFVLIRLGWYQAYLSAVSGMSLPQLVLIGAGFALSAFACMQLVQQLFDRHTGHAYYAVLGFLLVSAVLVFPGFTPGREIWAQLAMLVIGITTVRLMGNFERSKG